MNEIFIGPESRKIFYKDYGDPENKKIVLCVHGLNRNSDDFHHLGEGLKDMYRIIAPDMAGRGYSDNLSNKSDYNYRFYAKDIGRLLDKLKISSCDWIGTSMGGLIAMFLNEERPNLIKNLVLNDIGPLVGTKATEKVQNYLQKTCGLELDSYEEALNRTKKEFAFLGIENDVQWEFITKSSYKLNNNRFSCNYDPAILNTLNDSEELNIHVRDGGMWDLWKGMRVPVMLIWGRYSTMLTELIIKEMRDINPNIYLVSIPKVAHAPHLMNKEMIEEIKKWLKCPSSGERTINYINANSELKNPEN